MRRFLFTVISIGVLCLGVIAAQKTSCISPAVSVTPDPVALGQSVTIDQTLSNSCSGNGGVQAWWTNLEGPCDTGTLEFVRHPSIPANGSLTMTDVYTPPCTGVFTVTTTAQLGTQTFIRASTSFTVQ